MASADWKGQSGRTYKYWIYPIEQSFSATPANYIFAKASQPGKWQPVYIGETGDLSERFDKHHKSDCIKREGATHIHAHTSSADENVRKTEEADLIAAWNPPCNG